MTRERNPAQTKKNLLDALDRIIQQKPTNYELKEKLSQGKIVKINKSNIEKEAGLSNGAAGRHPDILDAIEAASRKVEYGDSEIPDDKIKEHPLYLKLKSKYDDSLTDRKKLRDEKSKLQDELNRKDESLNNHLAHTHELFLCLWHAIPPENIEERMRAAEKVSEVVSVNFKRE